MYKEQSKQSIHRAIAFAKRVSKVARKYYTLIKHKFAEVKRWHTVNKARYWGLTKMIIQCLLASVVVDCKRMVNLLCSLKSPPKIVSRVVSAK